MADNINEQRQFSSGGNNASNNNNVVSRKKNNGGGDLTASPKYNKSNIRGYNRDSQQQKQHRPNNNYREQRGNTTGEKYRQHDSNQPFRDEKRSSLELTGIDDENLDDDPAELFDFDEEFTGKRGGSARGGNSKKTNMNHLLNFHYRDKQRVNRRSFNSYQRWSSGAYRQSFSKEQFLQANCQFVVQTGSNDYSLHCADPDLAIDWSHVEQVRLHSMETLKCPICLSEPQAGKITRCGHVYCWSCLLHYLALSDKPWRKCPVCSESIYKHDIRSVRGIVSQPLKTGDWIHFRLMVRERGSTLFHPRKTSKNNELDDLTMEMKKKNYAHLLKADDQTILNEIIEKEKLELLKQLEEDGDQPEACFIKQALEENNEREKILREQIEIKRNNEQLKLIPKSPVETEKYSSNKSTLMYVNAFDNIIDKECEQEEHQDSVSPVQIDESLPTTSNKIYFYQADEIHHGYLNGLNTRILLHEYRSYEHCPDELEVRIEAIESHFMTEELRSQFRSISHLPLTCEFQIIEIRLHPPIISPKTMQIFSEEVYRRRQYRSKKERLEKRRKQQAELVESQKLFSQYPPEMMYFPQESFPVNGTDSIEEFPAIVSSVTSSTASVQLSDENLSPPSSVSFAQMLKQQAPIQPKPVVTNKPIENKIIPEQINKNKKKKKKNKDDDESDEDQLNDDQEYYASVPNFRSSFSLEEVFDRLKMVSGEENPTSSMDQSKNNNSTKKKNKKTKQILFATGLAGQAKL